MSAKSFTEIKRWATLRCAHCGHRFRWRRDARHSTSNRDGKVFHGPCLSAVTWRAKAEERLAVLGLVVETTGVDTLAMQAVAQRRETTDAAQTAAGNRTWRVFYDLAFTREGATHEQARAAD